MILEKCYVTSKSSQKQSDYRLTLFLAKVMSAKTSHCRGRASYYILMKYYKDKHYFALD